MSSDNPNKPPTIVPATPSTPLPSSSFVTPDKFKNIAQRQKQRAQELNINLNTVQETQNEPSDESTNPQQDQFNEPDSMIDSNYNNESNEHDEMKEKFDLFVLQMQQENAQLKYSLSQTQQENAYLQYQQRLQYQQPQGQQLNSSLPVPVSFISIAGKPEYFTGDFKSNPETWIDQVYEFMLLTRIPPNAYVTFAATYMRDQARIWWSSMSQEDKIKNQDFYVFRKTLLEKYRPVNQQRTARTQLKTLKQLNSVTSYNNAFSNVIQLINDMSLADKLDNYLNGLKVQIQEKLITEEFTSLSDAMNAAARIDTLLYSKRNGNSFNPNYGNNNGFNKQKHGNQQAAAEVNNVQTWSMGPTENNGNQGSFSPMNEVNATINSAKLTQLTSEQRDQLKREGRCFKCRQYGHMVTTCPTNVNRTGISSSQSMKPSGQISNTKKY